MSQSFSLWNEKVKWNSPRFHECHMFERCKRLAFQDPWACTNIISRWSVWIARGWYKEGPCTSYICMYVWKLLWPLSNGLITPTNGLINPTILTGRRGAFTLVEAHLPAGVLFLTSCLRQVPQPLPPQPAPHPFRLAKQSPQLIFILLFLPPLGHMLPQLNFKSHFWRSGLVILRGLSCGLEI